MSSDATENDLPGMLGVAKGVAEQRFPHTMDAAVWADEFAKVKREDIDYGLMLSWFANAIMAGYDTARARAAVPSEIVPQTVCCRDVEGLGHASTCPKRGGGAS